MLRVCHVSPTYFAPESVLGGGERYAEELARAMARETDVKLVSFGPRAMRQRLAPGFERVILRNWTGRKMVPLSPRLFLELRGADVVHCHQYYVLSTFLAALAGRLAGKRVFVTDLGGGAWTPGFHLDQSRWIAAHLPISRYAARGLEGGRLPYRVIYGGVDLERYPVRPRPEHDGSVVFLGRLLPHKGIHHLVAALRPDRHLDLIGSEADEVYLEELTRLAVGKQVRVLRGLDDAAVVARLQQAMALVHPTPVDETGSAGSHELFGLALVEAMACGCPVIASDAASLPEIVAEGETGLLVPPNRPEAIAAALDRLAGDPALWRRQSAAARRRVEERFTWERVSRRCLEAYREAAVRRDRGSGW